MRSKIDALVQPVVDGHEMVGCVVGIVQDGRVQFAGYGETEKGSGKKPTVSTIYEIGSVSKAFTGTLLADLVNQGAVKLDDPLQKYLPKTVKAPMKDGQAITLEHLATHTSGLPRLPDNLQPKDFFNPYADYSAEQMYEFLGQHKLRRVPGEYEYSNYGMGLLGYVLADQQKTSYEQLMIDRIAKPLGMSDTRITLTEAQRKRLAPPYNAILMQVKNWDTPVLAGAGAIRSTARDMLKFIKAALEDDTKPVTQAIRFAQQKRHTKKDGKSIGLAWHLIPDGITWWHNGQTGGYSSWLSVIPSKKVGVVVLSNTATDKTDEIGILLTQLAFGLDVQPPRERKEVDVDPKVLESYTGVFAITPQFALTVTLENGKLLVQATNQSKIPLFAESATKFFCKVVDAQISFVPDAKGKVNQLILHQNGIDQKAMRQE